MRRVLVERLETEAVLAQDLVDANGVTLLRRGQPISPRLADRLRRVGIAEILVMDPLLADLDLQPPLNPDTISTVTARLNEIMTGARKAFQDGHPYTVAGDMLQPLARMIVDDLSANRHRKFEMIPVVNPDYLLGHLLNVAVLAVQLGRRSNLPYDRLVDLAAGGLVLDLGMLGQADVIRRAPRPLEPGEWSIIHQHPAQGVAWLGESVSAYTKAIVARHHERLDGSGYPEGTAGDQLHPMVRIAMVADVYVALTSDRPHRRRIPAHEAIDYIMSMSGIHFDPRVTRNLLSVVHPYPLGVRVRLGSGRVGVVVGDRGMGTRPIVRVFQEGTRRVDPPYEVDLSAPEFQTEFITEILYS
ncbi:MAG: HD domain-containing phosphohydrolase [Thermaerobacter sp.]|nr:hypothetical protein [Bacillota bacterium]REJ36052.1 MAG: hypothetical protein DIU84_06420 [Bacillota bacterium]